MTAETGSKYYIPSDYDIFISFNPRITSDIAEEIESLSIKFKTKLENEVS